MRVLVDADFLIALAKEDDSNHNNALVKSEELKSAVVFITQFTIPEAVTVLSYKVSQSASKKFLEYLRGKDFTELPLDHMICNEADKIFYSRREKGISWIDCLNVAMAKTHQLDGILSFDKFYKKAGIKNI